MQTSLDKPQSPPHKVKNILIRSFGKDRQDKNTQRQEYSYILKYSPKYYQTLAIRIKPFNPLLSKIKKIKKLKKVEECAGGFFKEILSQNLWFNLLTNSRKEIEETPQISPSNLTVKLRRSFWKRVNLQKIKFFPNVTRVLLSKWELGHQWNDSDPIVTIPEFSVHFLGNLRRLRSLDILVKGENYEQAKWVFEKLDGMGRLFERLETLIISVKDQNRNVKELFQNKKNLLSHVTSLSLSVSFDPVFAEIPQVCKNLNSLSLKFLNGVGEKPEFRNLLTSMQDLKELKSLKFVWPENGRNFWGCFKPQSTLRQLTLIFSVSDLINEKPFGENIEPKNAVEHWEDIQELDVLTFHVECDQPEEIIFAKQFITMILKKIKKICSLRYFMTGQQRDEEPFFVEEVSHLYESLERFEHFLLNDDPSKFDLKMMKPFRNLKELRLDGGSIVYENAEEIVPLLEENQKEGETSVLKIKVNRMRDQSWLGETLKKIEKIERDDDRNLEMLFDLRFSTEDLVDLLERLCFDIQAVKTIKGLVISLMFLNEQDVSPLPVEKLREILDKYHQINNLKLLLYNRSGVLRYSKLDGEKAQLDVSQ